MSGIQLRWSAVSHIELTQKTGCYETNVNVGKREKGIMHTCLKIELSRPLLWIIYLLHMNELPLQYLF